MLINHCILVNSYSNDIRARKNLRIPKVLRIPPHQQSPNHILSVLNDDCLRAIFERSEISDIDDQCAIASSCRRFQHIAADVFQRRYRNEHKSFIKRFIRRSVPLWRWEQYFSSFGQTIETVDLTNQSQGTTIILHFVANHCPNIKQIICQLTDKRCAMRLRGLFARLQVFKVALRGGVTYQDILVPNIEYAFERLTIRADFLRLTPIRFKKLIALDLDFKDLRNEHSFEKFFRVNTKLHILRLNKRSFKPAEFATISYLWPLMQLQELSLGGNSNEEMVNSVYSTFCRFKQLKVLSVASNIQSRTAYDSILRAIRDANIPLEYLNMTTGMDAFNVRLIGTISTIKTVTVHMHGLNDEHLLALVNDLRHLDYLHIISSKVSLNGIRRFIEIANPSTTAQFRLSTWSRRNIKQSAAAFRLINDILAPLDIQLNVVIPVYCTREESMALVRANC